MDHHPVGWDQQLHIMFALGIMAAYAAIPLTALRRLPVTKCTRTFAVLFFATCAITHLAIAVGFHDDRWMLVNDAVQLVSAVGFIACLTRQVRYTLRRRDQLRSDGGAP